MSAENILGRWSRRKVESRAAPPTPDLPEPSECVAEVVVDPDLIKQTNEAAIAALTGESDITVFLQKGVAEWAKNAALRRVWSMDPAICDFVGEARDYGYDWNSGEGVPGFGPILASDNATSILETMFSDVSRMFDKQVGEAGVEDEVAPLEIAPPRSVAEDLAARRQSASAAAETSELPAPDGTAVALSHDLVGAPPSQIGPAEASQDRRPHRQGSAKPI